MGNPKSPLPEGFSYCSQLINIEKTIARYRREANRAITDDPTGRAAYGRWMNSRRESDYEHFYALQLANIHQSVMGIAGENPRSVCACGLEYVDPFDDVDELTIPGHIHEGKLVTVLLAFVRNEERQNYDLLAICQTCGVRWSAVLKPSAENPNDPEPWDVDLEATLAQHEQH